MIPTVPPNALVAMAAIVALLVVASGIAWGLRRTDRVGPELVQRIQSWWWIIIIVFGILAAGETLTIIFFGFVSFLALKEFLSIVPTRTVDRRAIFWAYVAIPVNYYLIAIEWYGMFIIFVPVYVLLLLPVRMVLIGETRGFIKAAATLHWAAMLGIFCIGHIAYLVTLEVQNPAAGSIGPVLFLLFVTQFNDVSQYVSGKLLGRRKIIPKVSPNKTWEGFLGGIAASTVCAGFLAPFLTSLTFAEGLMAGALIATAGFFGDVVVSAVKRDLGIKDSGRFIPGHGGILDRLDSLTYAAPAFFHFFYYLKY